MKIIIFVFCLIFITIGYTSGADDQIPVEVIETTDSPVAPEGSSEVSETKEETPTVKPTEKPTAKPYETPKRRVPVHSRRTKPETKITEKVTERIVEKPVEKLVEKPVEKVAEKPVEKLVERTVEKPAERRLENSIPKSSAPVVDRGSGRFTENVIHSISNGPDDYSFAFKTEEGHNRDESVHIDRSGKSLDDNDDDLGTVSASGSYSFVSADGFEYTVDYVADAKGYHPKVNVRKL